MTTGWQVSYQLWAITELSVITDFFYAILFLYVRRFHTHDSFRINENDNVTSFCDDKQDVAFHKFVKIIDIFDHSIYCWIVHNI